LAKYITTLTPEIYQSGSLPQTFSLPKQTSISNLGIGFTLICFQCLSNNNVATQRCSWRNNWYTRGCLLLILSY